LPLLELHGLAASGLHDVDLSVEDGELVAILGAAGAGKSTLFAALCGEVPSSGSVVVDGERLYRRTPEGMARRGIAHIAQRGGVIASLTVRENLQLGAWVRRGAATRDLVRVFELFPALYEARERHAAGLDALARRQLALARAVTARARLLFLDEPAYGLSADAALAIWDAIRALNAAGATIVAVEQRARIALSAARRAVVLEAGRVVLSGSAGDLAGSDSVRRSYLGY
jgi:branched-chain amino acid transport system ATP-binding protein